MPQPTIQIKDAANITQTVNTINPNGQAVAADSQPVVLTSAQESALRNVTTTASALVQVSSTIAAQLLAANPSRRAWTVVNLGPGILYILRGTGTPTPTFRSFPPIPVDGYFESYLGATEAVQYIFGSAGTANVQEIF